MGRFTWGVSELWGFKCRGVSITQNFQHPLVAKWCIGREHVLEVQEWYRPLSACEFWWGSDIARRQGWKSSTFLSVTLLNDKLCECHFAINTLEFGNDLSIIGYGNVCRCAPVFNFVSTMLGRATAEWQSQKMEKFGIFRPSRATKWTDNDEIQHVRVDYGSTQSCQIWPRSV